MGKEAARQKLRTWETKIAKHRVWARFNQATRCFKGLLNCESAFRWYVAAAIESLIQDKIMYAELRPMLMDKSIRTDDGLGNVDHETQMRIILDEVEKKKSQLRSRGEGHIFPFGIKIIYSTPRSIPKDRMRRELHDCIKLKLQFPDLICGKSSLLFFAYLGPAHGRNL